MIHSKTFSHSRASEFYTQFFCPHYESFENAVKQTPLVIMLWGPRQRTHVWSNQREQIRDTLRRIGHTVFFSEQLGVPLTAVTNKGVEFLQSETADLIVVLQSSYDAVGSVQHFSEFRVVDSKMLLFIDAAASDERVYHRALDDLSKCYDNVETYEFPKDVAQDHLISKIVKKVNLMQMVKYCAIQKAQSWRLGIEASSLPPGQPDASVQPFRYNLLELYRDHRDEIDSLTDAAALFVLAYANYLGRTTTRALAFQSGLTETALRRVAAPLLRGQMMAEQGEGVVVTGLGRRVLESAGLTDWVAPLPQPRATPAQSPRVSLNVPTVGIALATLLLFFSVLFYWSSTNQSQSPLAYTPTRPAVTRTTTATPTPSVTPSPTIRR
jgi:hypothetical protein